MFSNNPKTEDIITLALYIFSFIVGYICAWMQYKSKSIKSEDPKEINKEEIFESEAENE